MVKPTNEEARSFARKLAKETEAQVQPVPWFVAVTPTGNAHAKRKSQPLRPPPLRSPLSQGVGHPRAFDGIPDLCEQDNEDQAGCAGNCEPPLRPVSPEERAGLRERLRKRVGQAGSFKRGSLPGADGHRERRADPVSGTARKSLGLVLQDDRKDIHSVLAALCQSGSKGLGNTVPPGAALTRSLREAIGTVNEAPSAAQAQADLGRQLALVFGCLDVGLQRLRSLGPAQLHEPRFLECELPAVAEAAALCLREIAGRRSALLAEMEELQARQAEQAEQQEALSAKNARAAEILDMKQCQLQAQEAASARQIGQLKSALGAANAHAASLKNRIIEALRSDEEAWAKARSDLEAQQDELTSLIEDTTLHVHEKEEAVAAYVAQEKAESYHADMMEKELERLPELEANLKNLKEQCSTMAQWIRVSKDKAERKAARKK